MCRVLSILLLAGMVLGGAGCGILGPKARRSFAPILDAEAGKAAFAALSLPHSPAVEPKGRERRPDAPKIAIEAHVFAIDPAAVAGLGIDASGASATLTARQRDALLEQVRSAKGAKLLSSPRVTVFSGQPASVAVLVNFNYVAAIDADGMPVIGNIPEGVMLGVTASWEKDGTVVFTRIDPKVTKLVKICVCEAAMVEDETRAPTSWQEPVVLVARAKLDPKAPIRVAPGGGVLVPLRDALVVGRSTNRRQIEEGTLRVTRDGLARFLARYDERGYPVDRLPLFVLLSPSLGKVEDSADERSGSSGP